MSELRTSPAVETSPVLIGGERRLAASGETIEAHNPATGELIGRFPRCGAADVAAAVEAARAAFPAWRATPATRRAALLLELVEALGRRQEELALLDAADNGSPMRDMRIDVAIGMAELRYFAGLALQLRGETIPVAHGRLNYTLREPFGVVGRIVPFNHPILFATMKIAAPLVAGNTVVLKPSEQTSLSALALADDLARIFPPGVINVVTGYGAEAGDAIVTHPGVPRVAFIGLAETGRAIQARAAGVAVKTVTLECGGKNPIVIFPDADLDDALEGVVRGMNFSFSGQSCGSTSRLIVHSDIHESFVGALAERIDGLRVGLPEDEATQVGALVSQAQLDKVRRYVKLGQAEGATLVAGGTRPGEAELANGFFIRPALFDGVDPGMRLAQEEIFGPVLAVMPFRDEPEALAIANDTRFGLTASIYTRDLRRAHAFARDVEAGFVWVNDSGRHFLGTPFGGFKESGLGREEDTEELYSYTQTKNVNVLFE
ncbi:MAG TPA: aldehyde dehydrogenase family protein [Gaiellales bacterium]|nr:aldehyde dehydrogenase family protein [Gaiellales bacterium]